MNTFTFDTALYEQVKEELNKKWVKEIIVKYNRQLQNKTYPLDFLSKYYSPILTVLRQVLGGLKNKQILEVGYRVPLFLDYLKQQGAFVYGIDVDPAITDKNLLRMSVENMNQAFLKRNKDGLDAVVERITLSKLYDENNFLETGEYRFKDKLKILLDLFSVLKPGGILVLQDDRGTIFTKEQFSDVGFKRILEEKTMVFKEGKFRQSWNVLTVYQKPG